jgi:uncharacterized protein YbbC (DUF1343 family)
VTVRTGLEVLRDDDFKALAGLRVGLMTNPSAVDRQLDSAYKVLTEAPPVNLVALFGPEHGFAGAAPDGEQVSAAVDPRTGLPVYSLYGETYRPTAEMLKNMDVLVCDIQDIGVRYYTYTWTVSHILEAAGEHGVRVMILDRPNPLGGVIVDGPSWTPGFRRLLGGTGSVRHGLTLGELAQMINARWNPRRRSDRYPCAGWRRAMMWEDTGLPWVPPSPNMPHLSTLQQYPGACLIEGTQLSEGVARRCRSRLPGTLDRSDGAGGATQRGSLGGRDGRALPAPHIPAVPQQMGRVDVSWRARDHHPPGALAACRGVAGRDHHHPYPVPGPVCMAARTPR